MAWFKYVAYDKSGKKIESSIEADTMATAQKELKNFKQLMVSSIAPAQAGGSASKGLFGGSQNVTGRDLEYLTSELNLLLESGVKFDQGVELLARAKKNTVIGEILRQISVKLKSGSTISAAFGSFSALFDKLYVNLLKIGEESGTLGPIFKGLSRDLKFRNDLRQTIIQATTYPLIIFAVCMLSVVFIFNYIVPKMAVLFADAEELPIHTQIILGISDWLMAYQLYVGVALLGGATLIYQNRKNQQLITWFHQRSRLVPGIRTVVEMSERIRFCSSMSLLLKAGIAMDMAVRLSAGNSANTEIRRELEGVSESIRKGVHLSEALAATTLFSDLFLSLIEIGEESGEVTQIFSELADRSRNEFTQWVSRVTTLLEPLLIITMGLIVGGVVVTMMLSVMSINDVAV
jgi:type II secretory pathway component PulF